MVLNPNTRLGTLSPIAEINPKTDETVIKQSYSEVKINSQILSEDQKQKLRQLIKEYDIIIAKHEFDVGSTHVVEHEIPLLPGKETPIRLRPYRIPYAHQQESRRQK